MGTFACLYQDCSIPVNLLQTILRLVHLSFHFFPLIKCFFLVWYNAGERKLESGHKVFSWAYLGNPRTLTKWNKHLWKQTKQRMNKAPVSQHRGNSHTFKPPPTPLPAPQGTALSVQKWTCVWRPCSHSRGNARDPEIQSQRQSQGRPQQQWRVTTEPDDVVEGGTLEQQWTADRWG